MHQPARFTPAVIVTEEGHLRRKGTGIVVGHDVLTVLVVFLLGLAVGALHLVDEEIIIQLPYVRAVVIGHHSESLMLYQHIVEPLVVAAGKLHRIAFRLIVGRVAVDHGLRVVSGGDDALEILAFQYRILQPMGALPQIPEKPPYIAGAYAIDVSAAILAVALKLIKCCFTPHIA